MQPRTKAGFSGRKLELLLQKSIIQLILLALDTPVVVSNANRSHEKTKTNSVLDRRI